MELKEELLEILNHSGFKSPFLDIEEESSSGRIGGFLISSTFKGMPQLDRQNIVWDCIEKHFPIEKQRLIGGLLTVTPQEADNQEQ